MRITFLNQTFGLGGAESWFLTLFSWLSNNGVDLNIFTTNGRFSQKLAVLEPKRIPIEVDLIGDWKGFVKGVLLLPMAFLYYGWIVFTARGKTDVLFLSGFIEKVLGSFWGAVFGIPVVWTEFGPYGNLLGPLQKSLYLSVVAIPKIIIVPSLHTKNWLVSFGIDPKKLMVIPCGMADPQIPKKKAQWDACCVSRLEPGKGQDLLIAAWAQIIKKIPNAKLLIVGEGDQYKNLKLEIRNLKLENNVFMAGWVENSLKIMADSKIVVFPTQWPLEGFGMVAVEAAAIGKPVIGYNFGPIPEIVDHKKTGILVKNGIIEAMADAITRLLNHPKFAKNLGFAAKQRFLHLFDIEKIGPKYLQVLEKACAIKN